MIIAQCESRMVAYRDNGMDYSNEGKAKLRLNGKIDAMESENPGAEPGSSVEPVSARAVPRGFP
jgi:hypothetical protein